MLHGTTVAQITDAGSLTCCCRLSPTGSCVETLVPSVVTWGVRGSGRGGAKWRSFRHCGHALRGKCWSSQVSSPQSKCYESMNLNCVSLSLASCLAMGSLPPAHTPVVKPSTMWCVFTIANLMMVLCPQTSITVSQITSFLDKVTSSQVFCYSNKNQTNTDASTALGLPL